MVDTEYQIFQLDGQQDINTALALAFQERLDADATERTHLFNGRYENIYIKRAQIPAIEPVLHAARGFAAVILNEHRGLSVGFWFNLMGPGDTTTRHRHDDDDELLSAVYYVSVPENSGDLVIFDNGKSSVVTPKEGRFVFFRPDVEHEVGMNNSQYKRLSIGMNFGVKV
ncbi:MAG: putative 2OG-Fe(II) oxygenase [Gammaproteobacteria bacterium]